MTPNSSHWAIRITFVSFRWRVGLLMRIYNGPPPSLCENIPVILLLYLILHQLWLLLLSLLELNDFCLLINEKVFFILKFYHSAKFKKLWRINSFTVAVIKSLKIFCKFLFHHNDGISEKNGEGRQEEQARVRTQEGPGSIAHNSDDGHPVDTRRRKNGKFGKTRVCRISTASDFRGVTVVRIAGFPLRRRRLSWSRRGKNSRRGRARISLSRV